MDHAADINRIAHQEKSLQLPQFNLEAAWQIGTLARNIATDRKHAIAIEVRRFGHPVFVTALDGTTPSSLDWLRRKANICQLFNRSSYGFGLNLAFKNQTLARHALSDRDYAVDGGAFPIAVDGTGVVGTITISGLDQRRDHELAVETLCAYLGKNYSGLALPPA